MPKRERSTATKRSSLATGPKWTKTGSLNSSHHDHTATVLRSGEVLIAGRGVSAELYDPITSKWRTVGGLNTDRALHTATLLPNGIVLVVGGFHNIVGGTVTLDSAELYDPATEAWRVTGSLHTARHAHTATLLSNGKVLVVGGTDTEGSSLKSAELYDPATEAWRVTGSLHTARNSHTATLLPNPMVLVAGGVNVITFLDSAELYNPTSGTWSITGSLNGPRYRHGALLLPNGKVLVMAGQSSNANHSELSRAELYDPATRKWNTTGSLRTARGPSTATLLPNGEVLVAGGLRDLSVLKSAELYDPATGSWHTTASLNTARGFHTATLLQNGKVLAAGGTKDLKFGTKPTILKSAELYGI